MRVALRFKLWSLTSQQAHDIHFGFVTGYSKEDGTYFCEGYSADRDAACVFDLPEDAAIVTDLMRDVHIPEGPVLDGEILCLGSEIVVMDLEAAPLRAPTPLRLV